MLTIPPIINDNVIIVIIRLIRIVVGVTSVFQSIPVIRPFALNVVVSVFHGRRVLKRENCAFA